MADVDSPEASKTRLDAGSGEPLHLQLRGHLRAQILNHSLPPGTSLPSEAQLQVRYGVSRSVVRQALGALADEGLIERGRGRGSTVAPRREHHRLVHRTSGLSAQIGSTGAAVGTEVLSLTVQDADASTVGPSRCSRPGTNPTTWCSTSTSSGSRQRRLR
ncbi:GntR family transcriptional regulator [Arthrobacter sp. B1805]|uniref:GntR family transcriptional regulator n=1 Tax=Arthrobacter sp. B1805 TaxID=2058892 RepID=UPI001C670FB5|nr:GntR family transcriptional regulator [Arthrobacter sp. B1805]